MPAEDVTEFGGWPRPPRWVWALAGVAVVAVLAGVVVARTGAHHAAASAPSGSPVLTRAQMAQRAGMTKPYGPGASVPGQDAQVNTPHGGG